MNYSQQTGESATTIVAKKFDVEQKRLGWYNGGMSNHSSEEIRNQWEFGVRGPQPEARCVCPPELILMYKFHQYWTPKGNLGFQQSMDSRPLLLQVMQFFCETKTKQDCRCMWRLANLNRSKSMSVACNPSVAWLHAKHAKSFKTLPFICKSFHVQNCPKPRH